MLWLKKDKIHILDVSRHQGDGINAPLPDYTLLPLDIKGIIARSSVGNYYSDATYNYHKEQSKKFNRSFGTYPVLHPNYTLAQTSERVKKTLGDDPPKLIMADCECVASWTMPSKQVVEARTYEFLEWLEGYYSDSRIVIYTALWYWNRWITHHSRFVQWPLHFARYPYRFIKTQYKAFEPFINSLPRKSKLPGDWNLGVAWQFSEKGSILGISSRSVDMNLMNADFYKQVFNDEIIVQPTDEWIVTNSNENLIVLERII